jgi:toxin ParE1/3/4
MSRRVVFRPLAEEDLDETFGYLWARSPQAAVAFIEAIRRMAKMVSEMPGMGRRWEHGEQDLPDVRSVQVRGFRAWLMVYTDKRRVVHVLRIIHGARDLDAGLDLGIDVDP